MIVQLLWHNFNLAVPIFFSNKRNHKHIWTHYVCDFFRDKGFIQDVFIRNMTFEPLCTISII